MRARNSLRSGRAVTARRLWALPVVLGILGIYGTASGQCATAGEHLLPMATAAVHHTVATPEAMAASTASTSPDHATPTRTPSAKTRASAAPSHHGEDGEGGDSAMALCLTLLLAFAAGALGRRRTTWVSVLARSSSAGPSRFAPVPLGRAPVSRFTVMRC